MELKLLMVMALSGLSVVSGLTCWKCQNARSRRDCILSGNTERCRGQSAKMSCQTEVRFHEGWGGNPMITTGCKETTACQNNRNQNNRVAWPSKHCNPRKQNSVCRCCCNKGFRCNRRNLLCQQRPLSNNVRLSVAPTPRSDQPAPGRLIGNFQSSGLSQRGNVMTILVNLPSS